jgi:hypothetical protein
MTWQHIPYCGDIHVVPICDKRIHTIPFCTCGITTKGKIRTWRQCTFSHTAADGRE